MKNLFTSKIFWLNVIGLIIVSLEYSGTVNWLPPDLVTTAVMILNIILRFFTGKKVYLPGNKPVE